MRISFSTLTIGVLAVGLFVGLAFAGGVAWGRRSAPETVVTVQGQPASTARPEGAGVRPERTGSPTPTGERQTSVVGTVVKVEGDLIEVSTATASVSVRVGPPTAVRRLVDGSMADISPGQGILVQGQPNPGGAFNAISIQVGPLEAIRPQR